MKLAIECERENERGSERRESVEPKRGSERHSVSDCAVESRRAVRERAEVLVEERLVELALDGRRIWERERK